MNVSDSVDRLYQTHGYPPMSHPSADPAVISVAAWFSGLKPPSLATARILEIGCASGHHLLPLAMRWPGSICTGVDLSRDAIGQAKQRMNEAGIKNASFYASDLRELNFEGQEFDFIIAHGVFSWVPDDAKKALLEFCSQHLSPSGVATISFNLHTGWEKRLPVISAVRRIQKDHDVDVMQGLMILHEVVEDESIRMVIDDMRSKGPEILAFDDFAPVNDPWSLDRFAAAAVSCGLRWLGDSDPAENIPSSLDDAARESLASLVGDPLRMQMTADALADRTFRSALLCREEAPITQKMTTGVVMDLSVRLPEISPTNINPMFGDFLEVLKKFGPDCVPVGEVLQKSGMADIPAAARMVFHAITRGYLRARVESVRIDQNLDRPCLDGFRMLCARTQIPLVDRWHSPCLFSARTYALLAEMDGSKTIEELAEISKQQCPDLAFMVWLKHLNDRGMFL